MVGDKIKSLCTHVKVLTETVSQLLTKNDRLNNDWVIQKTVSTNLDIYIYNPRNAIIEGSSLQ